MTITAATNNKKTDDTVKILASAPPQWHSVLLVVIMVSYFLHRIPTLASLDKDATLATFTHRVFSQSMSIRTLAWIRLGIAASIFLTSLYVALAPGWDQMTTYVKSSQCRKVINHISGIKTLYPFTSWSWNVLGLAFAMSSYLAFCGIAAESSGSTSGLAVSPWILRLTLILWEIAAPCTLLVAATIRYAIWPAVLKAHGETVNLKKWRNIMMHNINVIFALSETALLGGLPIRVSHMSLAPLYGAVYIVFTWNITRLINDDPRAGPQFLYFFMDTTVPGYFSTLAIVALLVVLLVFFLLFCFTHPALRSLELAVYGASEEDGGDAVASVVLRVLFVLGVSSTVMRFRD